MKEKSSLTCENTSQTWIAQEPDGLTIEVTFTVSKASHGNVRTKRLWPYLNGLQNYMKNVEMLELLSGPLFTRSVERQTQESSTPHSHSGCWCNSSKRQGTND